MPITRTRIRTQTALVALVKQLAENNDELAYLDTLRARTPTQISALAERKQLLLLQQHALRKSLQVFDGSIDPETIGRAPTWRKRLKLRSLSPRLSRYLAALATSQV